MLAPEAYMVATPFRIGEIDLERGDRYAPKGEVTTEVDRTLKYLNHVVPLTRENYTRAIASRPLGTVGRGFTAEELVEFGVLTEAEAAKCRQDRLDEAEEVKGYFLLPFKSGHFTLWEVQNAAGELMRPSRIRGRDKALAFIDTLPVIEPVATPVTEEESSHDVDVQRESVDAA
jgi:hypothetical protein